MNTELIKLARKAAKEWASEDGYSHASQIVNMLCDELEAGITIDATLLPKEAAYRAIAKHVFHAYRKYEGQDKVAVLLADDIHEAERLAMAMFGTSSVYVRRVIPTKDSQIYEV